MTLCSSPAMKTIFSALRASVLLTGEKPRRQASMPDARKFLTADERLKELQRDRKALQRQRMIREVVGPVWHRMVRVVPLSLEGQGRLVARVLVASREDVIEALRTDAVFAVDTAMRLAHGAG